MDICVQFQTQVLQSVRSKQGCLGMWLVPTVLLSGVELCSFVLNLVNCVELHKLPEFSEICVLPDTCSCCDP